MWFYKQPMLSWTLGRTVRPKSNFVQVWSECTYVQESLAESLTQIRWNLIGCIMTVMASVFSPSSILLQPWYNDIFVNCNWIDTRWQ